MHSLREDDLQPGPKLPAHLAAAFDTVRGIVLLLMPDGTTLKRYAYPAMQWQANYELGVLAHQMAYDPGSGRVFLGVIDPASFAKPRARGFGQSASR